MRAAVPKGAVGRSSVLSVLELYRAVTEPLSAPVRQLLHVSLMFSHHTLVFQIVGQV